MQTSHEYYFWTILRQFRANLARLVDTGRLKIVGRYISNTNERMNESAMI